ncbi:MAG: DUF362 domain-containing protein [Gemmatimonadota bacterium]|nr:MAG: DUF362 domain-containing protein [Gemmatimonadota bacterium]
MPENEMSRRAFIGETFGLCVAAPAILKGLAKEEALQEASSPIRRRLANPYLENGKPIVVVVRGTEFPAMLAKAMELLGGFSRFGSGKSVIVKPNFVFDKRTRYPTTTDEESVLTTVQYLQAEGFSDITVADRRARKVDGRAGGKFEWSGLNEKAQAGGFKTDSLLDDGVAEAVEVKNERWTHMSSVGVIKKIYEADLIINMPTVKRHTQTGLTCALKNMMGLLDVPTTMNMHLWGDANSATRESMPEEEILRRLSLTIAEAAMAVNPELTVVDARTVLCENHLSVTTGEPREANRLIVSGDPLAADIWAAALLKEVHQPYQLGFTKDTFEYAARLGIGVADPSGIVLKEVEV